MGPALVWEKGRQLKQFGTNSYEYNNDGKDIFNGNIKKQYIDYVKFSLIFVSVLWFVFFVFFLVFPFCYENVEYGAKIMMFAMSGISFLCSFLYPAISVYAIRNYEKHPKLAKAMIKEFVFQDFEVNMIKRLMDQNSESDKKKD